MKNGTARFPGLDMGEAAIALPAFLVAWAQQTSALGWERPTCSVGIHRLPIQSSMPKNSGSGFAMCGGDIATERRSGVPRTA